MPPEPPGEGLSPGEILHLNDEEANLLNTYLRSRYVRTIASVSLSSVNVPKSFFNLIKYTIK